jgi:hypothetical protein
VKFFHPGIQMETLSTILFTIQSNNGKNNLISKSGVMEYKIGTKEKPID